DSAAQHSSPTRSTPELTATDAAATSATATTTPTKDTAAPVISAVSDSPDPFSPNGDTIKDSTTISYTLSESASVTIRIYDGGTLDRTMTSLASSRLGVP